MNLKRFLLLMLTLCLLFSSCEKTPNMTALLAYEHENMRFTLKITDKTDFFVILTLDNDKDVITFTDEKLAGISVKFADDGAVQLTYEHYEIPLPSSALLKALHWKNLFHLSEKNLLWRIEKETLGGIAVYACRADGITVHIDAGTFLPLKITGKDIVIDVLESENLSPIIPK